jgi:hypothetical protein
MAKGKATKRQTIVDKIKIEQVAPVLLKQNKKNKKQQKKIQKKSKETKQNKNKTKQNKNNSPM